MTAPGRGVLIDELLGEAEPPGWTPAPPGSFHSRWDALRGTVDTLVGTAVRTGADAVRDLGAILRKLNSIGKGTP